MAPKKIVAVIIILVVLLVAGILFEVHNLQTQTPCGAVGREGVLCANPQSAKTGTTFQVYGAGLPANTVMTFFASQGSCDSGVVDFTQSVTTNALGTFSASMSTSSSWGTGLFALQLKYQNSNLPTEVCGSAITLT